ncbi:maltoporin [Corallincola luteus]|uniref:Maltoporin n=1 Tax=Corallincola luteus TaxID=1775177 RepID=A0ABY2AJQ0_9GAMM|nr:carbohydrate porin [Corallincola luteus]TCI03002.1 maltoporin [Corallincola luteus]
MAKIKALPIALAIASALTAASASAVEFHGYMRAGVGQNADGGGQVCYGNGGPSAHMVGRLGDECDMYAELTLAQEVYNRDGKVFKVQSTVAYGTDETGDVPQMGSQGNSWQAQGGDASSPWEGGRLSVREMFASAQGILGDSTVWIGKRFGQRKDVHHLDFFYLMNSGTGAGFDGLTVGPGKLSFNWSQTNTADGMAPAFPDFDWGLDDNNDGVPNDDQNVVNGDTKNWHRTNKFDVRYSLPVFGSHNLEGVLIVGDPTLTDAQEEADAYDETGVLAMIEHTMPLMGGFNKLSFTYGTNGFANLRDGFWGLNYATWLTGGNDDADPTGWAILNHGVVKFGKKVEMAYSVMHTDVDTDNGNDWFDATATGVVVRPMYKWNDTMSTQLEIGYDTIDYDNEGHQARIRGEDLTKVTLAQTWSPLQNGGIWARPQLRLFVSNYSGDRAVDDAETMVGAQVEAWW